MGDQRLYHIVLLGGLVLAFVGFFVGTRKSGYEGERARSRGGGAEAGGDRSEQVRRAPTYEQLMKTPHAENRQWRDDLSAEGRGETADGTLRGTIVSWRAEDPPRSANRAYGGAPPTVPHPIQQRGELACAACHTDGVRVEGRSGPAMSHGYLENCTQCHAASSPKLPFGAEPPSTVSTENHFVGRPEATEGPRAYAGAPPRIPHRTEMREDCASCHGQNGRPGPMSHEYMPNCTQCHAASEGPPVVGDSPESVPPGSRFRGLEEDYAGGRRAWEGAPPRMPHQLHMRENCISCHGAAGEVPIRTSHPWRQSCTQCHAPTGEYGFRPPTNLRPFR